jgi:hypothetical protein
MTLGEGSTICGTGSQTGSNRWGDYTAIDVDPTDDTTFWYINEYVPTTSSIGWRLRIGAFNLTAGPQATPCPVGPTPTPTPTPGPCESCNFTVGTGTFVPGVTDIGSHCDDCGTPITLPFPVTFYGQTFTTADAGSNGHLTLGTADDAFMITCSPFGIAGTTFVMAPYWTDQCTGACATITCDTCGIFTTVTGSQPNRIFYIEWRTQYYNQNQTLNYEIAPSGTRPNSTPTKRRSRRRRRANKPNSRWRDLPI